MAPLGHYHLAATGGTDSLTGALKRVRVSLPRQNPRPGFASRNYQAPRRSFCSAFFVPAMAGRAGAPSGAPLSLVGGNANPVRSATQCRFASVGGLTPYQGTACAQSNSAFQHPLFPPTVAEIIEPLPASGSTATSRPPGSWSPASLSQWRRHSLGAGRRLLVPCTGRADRQRPRPAGTGPAGSRSKGEIERLKRHPLSVSLGRHAA